MTLRGFLAASRSNEDERGSSPEPFLDEIPPNELSRFQHWGAILRTDGKPRVCRVSCCPELSGSRKPRCSDWKKDLCAGVRWRSCTSCRCPSSN